MAVRKSNTRNNMANEFKEFTELLLSNIQRLTNKVDELQGDMSDIKSDVAVLKETKLEVAKLTQCVEEWKVKQSQIEKDLAIKSSKWGAIGSIAAIIILLIIGILSGLFKAERSVLISPSKAQEQNQPLQKRGIVIHPDTTKQLP